jgi:hypothetical protein
MWKCVVDHRPVNPVRAPGVTRCLVKPSAAYYADEPHLKARPYVPKGFAIWGLLAQLGVSILRPLNSQRSRRTNQEECCKRLTRSHQEHRQRRARQYYCSAAEGDTRNPRRWRFGQEAKMGAGLKMAPQDDWDTLMDERMLQVEALPPLLHRDTVECGCECGERNRCRKGASCNTWRLYCKPCPDQAQKRARVALLTQEKRTRLRPRCVWTRLGRRKRGVHGGPTRVVDISSCSWKKHACTGISFTTSIWRGKKASWFKLLFVVSGLVPA